MVLAAMPRAWPCLTCGSRGRSRSWMTGIAQPMRAAARSTSTQLTAAVPSRCLRGLASTSADIPITWPSVGGAQGRLGTLRGRWDLSDRGCRHHGTRVQGTRLKRAVRVGVRHGVHGGEVAVSDKADDKWRGNRDNELRKLAESMAQKPKRDSAIDEMSLESRRRAIAYGRARGNA